MATVALLVAGALWFSVAFVRDREVGSLIAAIGVVGEAYQFAVQLLLRVLSPGAAAAHPRCTGRPAAPRSP